jgi:hypothetical protein
MLAVAAYQRYQEQQERVVLDDDLVLLFDYYTLSCVAADEVPQGTDGYVYYQYFSGSQCTGESVSVVGFYGDYCFASATGTYYKYYFEADDCSGLVYRTYADAACSQYLYDTDIYDSFTDCSPFLSNRGSIALKSQTGKCKLGGSIPMPMDSVLIR